MHLPSLQSLKSRLFVEHDSKYQNAERQSGLITKLHIFFSWLLPSLWHCTNPTVLCFVSETTNEISVFIYFSLGVCKMSAVQYQKTKLLLLANSLCSPVITKFETLLIELTKSNFSSVFFFFFRRAVDKVKLIFFKAKEREYNPTAQRDTMLPTTQMHRIDSLVCVCVRACVSVWKCCKEQEKSFPI